MQSERGEDDKQDFHSPSLRTGGTSLRRTCDGFIYSHASVGVIVDNDPTIPVRALFDVSSAIHLEYATSRMQLASSHIGHARAQHMHTAHLWHL